MKIISVWWVDVVDAASCSAASEEGTFDSDTVVESVTILGVSSKPSSVTVHLSGEDLLQYCTEVAEVHKLSTKVLKVGVHA